MTIKNEITVIIIQDININACLILLLKKLAHITFIVENINAMLVEKNNSKGNKLSNAILPLIENNIEKMKIHTPITQVTQYPKIDQ